MAGMARTALVGLSLPPQCTEQGGRGRPRGYNMARGKSRSDRIVRCMPADLTSSRPGAHFPFGVPLGIHNTWVLPNFWGI